MKNFILCLVAIASAWPAAAEINFTPINPDTVKSAEAQLSVGDIFEEFRPPRDRRRRRRRRPRRPRRHYCGNQKPGNPLKVYRCAVEDRWGDYRYVGESRRCQRALDKAYNRCERHNRRCYFVRCRKVMRSPF